MKKTLRNILLMSIILGGGFIIVNRFAAREGVSASVTTVFSDIPLSAAHGRTVKLADYSGRWVLLFFGYRSCPDICPTTLAYLKNEYRRAGKGSLPQVVFISVDPKRDRPEDLESYVKFFDPRFEGMTTDQANLKSLTQQLGVFYAYQEAEGGGARKNYTVQHTSSLFLIDPQGRLDRTFSPPFTNGTIATAIAGLAH